MNLITQEMIDSIWGPDGKIPTSSLHRVITASLKEAEMAKDKGEPFSIEWHVEMMKWPKVELVGLLRKVLHPKKAIVFPNDKNGLEYCETNLIDIVEICQEGPFNSIDIARILAKSESILETVRDVLTRAKE